MSLSKILENCRVWNEYHTHVSMGDLCVKNGTFQINRNVIDNFYSSFSLEKGPKGILEKPQVHLPVLVDFDLKKKSEEKEEKLYSKSQLESIVRDYQDVIRSIVDNYEPKHSICCVLEKPSYRSGEYIKNGFHLHFPYLFLSKNDQETHLLPRVIKLISKNDAFRNLVGKGLSGTLVDKGYLKAPWLMYGSQKSEESGCYKLTTIYNDELDEIELEDAFSNYKIYDQDESEIEMKTEEEIEYNLPRILSVIPWYRQITELKPNLQPLLKQTEYFKVNGESLIRVDNIPRDDDMKKELSSNERQDMIKWLGMINLNRFRVRPVWLSLAYMIKSDISDQEDGLELFLKLSEDCGYEQFDDKICSKTFESIIINPEQARLSYFLLKKWLKEDNILQETESESIAIAQNDISKKVLNDMIEYLKNQKHITHLNISEIFYKYYSKDYYFTDVGWIKYDDTKGWVKGDDELIIIPLMKQFGKVLMDYAIKCEKEDNKKEIPENPKVKDLQEKIDGLYDDIFDIGNDQEHKDEPCIIASGHNEKIILLMKKETDKKNKDKKKEVEKINKEKQRRREKCKKEIDRYESLKQKEIEKYNNKVSKEEDKEKNAWVNKLKDNASDLQNLPNIMSCIKTLRAKCKDNSILNELDVLHPEIFPFSDMKGFNLDTGEVIDIQREHKILSHTGYPLPERKQDEVDFATEYFNSFLLPDQLDNYISVIVQSLYGKNKNQIIGFLLGEGSNGKSFTKDYILKPIFGELFGVLPSTQLTKKDTGKDQANSALSSCMGKRMVMINEPPNDAQNKEPFIISTIKEMTGDIMMKVRDLHSKAFNMYITFTPYVCLNSFPPLSSNDSAIERRIECLYHRIIFKDKNDLDYDPTNQFQKLKNEEFTKLVISKRNGILWYLLESYFKNKGQIIRSDENIQKKLEIMTDNNPLKDFLTGYRKSNTFIRSKVLHTKYSSNNKNQQLSPKEFNKFLRNMQTIMDFHIEVDENNGNKIYLEAIPFQEMNLSF